MSIHGNCVDTVEDIRDLGVYLNSKLDWRKNTEAVSKKGQSRLYVQRRQWSFNILQDDDEDVLPVWGSGGLGVWVHAVCWGSRLRVTDSPN